MKDLLTEAVQKTAVKDLPVSEKFISLI